MVFFAFPFAGVGRELSSFCAPLACGLNALPRFNAHLSRRRDPWVACIRARYIDRIEPTFVILLVVSVHGIPALFPSRSLRLGYFGFLSFGQA